MCILCKIKNLRNFSNRLEDCPNFKPQNNSLYSILITLTSKAYSPVCTLLNNGKVAISDDTSNLVFVVEVIWHPVYILVA